MTENLHQQLRDNFTNQQRKCRQACSLQPLSIPHWTWTQMWSMPRSPFRSSAMHQPPDTRGGWPSPVDELQNWTVIDDRAYAGASLVSAAATCRCFTSSRALTEQQGDWWWASNETALWQDTQEMCLIKLILWTKVVALKLLKLWNTLIWTAWSGQQHLSVLY